MSGELNGLIILGALWFVLSRVASRGRNVSRRPESRAPLPARPRMETLLRDLQRSLEQTASTRVTVASSEARSLESDVRPGGRVLVDLDDEAAEIETRRIQAAEARNLPQSRAQPAAVEQIKAEPAEHTAAPGLSPKQLREAIIWREILGPPVSER